MMSKVCPRGHVAPVARTVCASRACPHARPCAGDASPVPYPSLPDPFLLGRSRSSVIGVPVGETAGKGGA